MLGAVFARKDRKPFIAADDAERFGRNRHGGPGTDPFLSQVLNPHAIVARRPSDGREREVDVVVFPGCTSTICIWVPMTSCHALNVCFPTGTFAIVNTPSVPLTEK